MLNVSNDTGSIPCPNCKKTFRARIGLNQNSSPKGSSHCDFTGEDTVVQFGWVCIGS